MRGPLLVVIGILLGSATGHAQAGPMLANQLKSDQPDEIKAALDGIQAGTKRQFVPAIVNLLRDGPPDSIANHALETLGALRSPAAIEALAEFTRHRRADARRRAYQALAAIGGRRVQPLLEQGLRDSDRTVRGTSAIALGDLGYRTSVEVLFRAFERGVVEAAAALGKLADDATVERFGKHLGSLPLSVLLSGYHEVLRRRDIAAETKRRIVIQLGEVSGAMVQRFLQDYLTTFPPRSRNALKTLVEKTLRRVVPDPSRPPAGRTRPARHGP